jgi:hypothetical protein
MPRLLDEMKRYISLLIQVHRAATDTTWDNLAEAVRSRGGWGNYRPLRALYPSWHDDVERFCKHHVSVLLPTTFAPGVAERLLAFLRARDADEMLLPFVEMNEAWFEPGGRRFAPLMGRWLARIGTEIELFARMLRPTPPNGDTLANHLDVLLKGQAINSWRTTWRENLKPTTLGPKTQAELHRTLDLLIAGTGAPPGLSPFDMDRVRALMAALLVRNGVTHFELAHHSDLLRHVAAARGYLLQATVVLFESVASPS